MPHYSPPEIAGKRQELNSPLRQTYFLRSLSNDQYAVIQEAARTATDPNVHPDAFADLAKASRHQLIYGLWQEHAAKRRGEKTGAGLGSGLKALMVGIGKPISGLYNYARNFSHAYTHNNQISGHTRLVAYAIQETYKADTDSRKKQLGDYDRVEDLSSDWLDVWKNDTTNQILVTCRGSRDASDFAIDDLGILSGIGPRDLVSSELSKIFEAYDDDYEIELSGHSLGGSLIALAMSKNPDIIDPERIDFFNPGTTPIPGLHDAVNSFSKDERAHYYMNALDAVSLGQQAGEAPVNLIMNKPQSWVNPVANHMMDQWTFQQKVPWA